MNKSRPYEPSNESDMNPASKLFDLASAAPERIALEFPDHAFTLENLAALVSSFAMKMRDCGVGGGTLVEIRKGDDLVRLAVCFATAALGAKLLVIDEGLNNPASPEAEICLTTGHIHDSGESFRGKTFVIDESWAPKSSSERMAPEGSIESDAPWIIASTVWTVGPPRLLSISHRLLAARLHTASAISPRAGKRIFALPGIGRTARLMEAINCILAGGTWIAEEDSSVLRDDGARVVVGTAPDLLRYARLAAPQALGPAELATSFFLDADISAILDQFKSVSATVTPLEFGPLCCLPIKHGRVLARFDEGSLGETEILFVDGEGSSVKQGHTGIALIKSPHMADMLDPSDLEQTSTERQGFLPLHRVGRRLDDGNIEIGQTAHFIQMDTGQIVDAAEVEESCRLGHDIVDAIAFLNPKDGAVKEFFAFLKAEEGRNQLQLIASAKYHVGKRVGKGAVPRIIQVVGDIPRDSFGRPDREACAKFILEARGRSR